MDGLNPNAEVIQQILKDDGTYVASHGLRTSRFTPSETHTSVPHFFI